MSQELSYTPYQLKITGVGVELCILLFLYAIQEFLLMVTNATSPSSSHTVLFRLNYSHIALFSFRFESGSCVLGLRLYLELCFRKPGVCIKSLEIQ